jgi:hypothetical protein
MNTLPVNCIVSSSFIRFIIEKANGGSTQMQFLLMTFRLSRANLVTRHKQLIGVGYGAVAGLVLSLYQTFD